MKHLLLLITILASISQSIFAQESPWIYESKQWSTLTFAPVPPEDYSEATIISFLKSDTIINDVNYFTIYQTENEDLSDAKFSGLCIRQEGDKVYHYNTQTQKELLLFDFSKKVGDEFTYYDGIQAKITNIYTFYGADRIGRRAFQLVANDGGRDEWVEGIGSMLNGIQRPCISWVGVGFKLLCCRDNNRQLYQNTEYNTCFRKTYPLFFLTKDHTKWREINRCGAGDEIPVKYNLHDYEVRGDTVINNNYYKKVYLTVNEDNTSYYAAIRMEEDVLYCTPANNETEYTLADYRWTNGAKLQFKDAAYPTPYEFDCKVAGQMEMESDCSHDYIQLEDHWGRIEAPSKDVRFIQYFGSTLGLFSYLLMNGHNIDCQMFNELVSIHIGEDLIYQNPYYTEDGIFVNDILENRWLGPNTKWTEVRYRTIWNRFFEEYHYKLKGVEYVDGKYYWKVCSDDREIALMREDKEGNLYMRSYDTENQELLLYSLGGKEPWKIGDKIRYTDWYSEKPEEIEETITRLENYTLENGDVVPAAITGIGYLIYGLGSTNAVMIGRGPQPTDGSQTALLEYYRKWELIFQSHSLIGIESVRTSDRLIIRNEGNSITFKQTTTNSDAMLQIYNVNGQNIGTYPMTDNEVTIRNLSAGIYLYRWFSKADQETGRFVIQTQ